MFETLMHALHVADALLTPQTPPGVEVAYAIAWLPIAMIGSALIQAGSSWVAGKRQTSAAKASEAAQVDAADRAMEWEREQEERRREEWERTEAENARRWESEVAREQGNLDRYFGEAILRDRRREPYRVAGRAALADLDQRRQASMADLLPTGRI